LVGKLTMKWLLVWLAGLAFLAGSVTATEDDSPAALVRAGWDNYRLGEFNSAILLFERAAELNDPAALYALATAWNLRRPREDRVKATALYRQAIALAPQSDWAAWSLLALARMNATLPPGKEPPLAERLAGYQAVVERFSRHPAGQEAFLFQQATRLTAPGTTSAEAEAVLAQLHLFLRDRPTTSYQSATWCLVAYACEMLGRKQELLAAVIAESETTEVDVDNPRVDLSWRYWRIATVAQFEVGDFTVARTYYRKLIAEYPTEQRVFLAKQQLQRMDKLEEQLRRELPPR